MKKFAKMKGRGNDWRGGGQERARRMVGEKEEVSFRKNGVLNRKRRGRQGTNEKGGEWWFSVRKRTGVWS